MRLGKGSMSSLLKATGITKSYNVGDIELEVLKGINFSLKAGEIVAVVGPSGVGKSTFLHILGALDHPSSGSVSLRSVDLFGLSDAERARFRNKQIGFVFQFHHLLSDFSAVENVMLPLRIQGLSQVQARKQAMDFLCLVGLSERIGHLPSELSGGEAQRVAVARALVTGPQLVLADEPTGNLDVERSTEIHELVWKLAREMSQAYVLVTHDVALAEQADRIVKMEDGRIVL